MFSLLCTPIPRGLHLVRCTKQSFVSFATVSALIAAGTLLLVAQSLSAQSLNLNGSASGLNYVYVPDNDALDLSDDFTVEAWVYPTNVVGGRVISKWNGSTGSTGWLVSILDSRLSLYVIGSNGYNNRLDFSNGKAIFTTNQWYHVAFTFDKDGDVIGYVNGQEVSRMRSNTGAITANTHNLNIGNTYTGGGIAGAAGNGSEFDGKIDEVRIWNSVKTARDLQQGMFNKQYGSESGLVVYYDFNGDLEDGTANALTASIYTTSFATISTILDGGTDVFSTSGGAKTANHVITLPSTFATTSNNSYELVGIGSTVLDGFGSSDNLYVHIRSRGGALSLSSTTGLTVVLGSSSGSTELAFTATQSNAEAALQSLGYYATSVNEDAEIQVTAILTGSGSTVFNTQNGHYYVFNVSTATRASAKTSAAGFTLSGQTGYLATIMSSSENSQLSSLISGDAWVAASDATSEGIWVWDAGPEQGEIFYGTGAKANAYHNWNSGEPNDAGGNEDGVELKPNGSWNDLNTSDSRGFVIEYGGLGQLQTSVKSSAIDVSNSASISTGVVTIDNDIAGKATFNGSIDALGGIGMYGFVYDTTSAPTLSAQFVQASVSVPSATGPYNATVTTLLPNKTYYVRSYARSQTGSDVIYGNEVSFYSGPTIASTTPTDNATGVQLDANLSITFSQPVRAVSGFVRIYRASTDALVESVDVTGGRVSGSETTTVLIDPIANLAPNTAFYVQIDEGAFNSTSGVSFLGVSDKTSWIFTTTASTIPTVTTGSVSSRTSSSATMSGILSAIGGAAVTARGICYATTAYPTAPCVTPSGTSTGAFSAALTSLLPNTVYYTRAFATNSEGTAYGGNITFITGRDSTTVSGSSNFHLLGSPYTGAYLDELLAPLWTQGMEGADTPTGAANVWTYDGQNWVALSDLTSTSRAAGEGFLVYIFADADFDGQSDLPLNIGASLTESTGPVSVAMTYQVNQAGGSVQSGWNLVANPYAVAVDADEMSLGGTDGTNDAFSGAVYVWDAQSGIWLTRSAGTGSLTDGVIPAFQGFFVKSTDNDGTVSPLQFSEAMQVATQTRAIYKSGDVAQGKEPFVSAASQASSAMDHAAVLSLRLSTSNDIDSNSQGKTPSTSMQSDQAFLVWTEDGGFALDHKDALKLSPLEGSARWILASVSDAHLLSIQFLPVFDGSVDPIRIPLELSWVNDADAKAQRKSATLAWDYEMLASVASHTIWLADHEAGTLRQLSGTGEVQLDLAQRSEAEDQGLVMGSSGPNPRFELIMTTASTLTSLDDVALEVPGQIVLEQNHPNPFNPTTTIRFALPQATQGVSLEVMDVLGRRVDLILDSRNLQAGWHTVSVDASHLSSGSYLYRLTAGGQVVTRTFTLIK